MARYKHIDYSSRFLAVDLSEQILPGSFEHTLQHLIDHELSLSKFEAHFKNDKMGAPAYPPAVLLKVVLLAYSKGMVSSRQIEAACRKNVVFMAISGDSQPHFTTVAQFVSSQREAVVELFAQVLVICNRHGLIGREMFAIDGVKLPSNASKAKSGTRADFEREAAKMEAAMAKVIKQHEASDAQGALPSARVSRRMQRLERDVAQIRGWLEEHPEDRKGPKNTLRQSNRTDNQSAKMATNKGVIQGYTAVAAVDQKHQIIVAAQAHGVGQEQELLIPVLDELQGELQPRTLVAADSGYCSEDNLEHLEQRGIEAIIPDGNWRKRDERFGEQQRHKDKPEPLWDKTSKPAEPKLFRPQDFKPAVDLSHCICPAGKRLYRNGRHRDLNGFQAIHFTGAKRDCAPCLERSSCLRKPDTTQVRQVAIFIGRTPGKPERALERMKRKVDSAHGREMIGRRFATVEPVFGNLRHNKRLDRFSLRGRNKVDGQWKLYCLVHNIEKLANQGYSR